MNLICSRAAIIMVLLLGASSLGAVDAAKSESTLKPALRNGPMAEMPARAASLVKQSRIRQREATTIDVVKSSVEINAVAAPSIVAAISKAVPEMADVAAGQAASMLPKESAKIARAAAAAAPSMAGRILIAVCRNTPADYRQIAVCVSEVAPTAGKDILRSVTVIVPELKPQMDRQLAGYGLTMPRVAETLAVVAPPAPTAPLSPATVATGPAPSPVVVATTTSSTPPSSPVSASSPLVSRGAPPGPPFVPLSRPPTNNGPSTFGAPPPAGRNYARP